MFATMCLPWPNRALACREHRNFYRTAALRPGIGLSPRRLPRSGGLRRRPNRGRRLHLMADWTSALLFWSDIVKIGLASGAALLLRDAAAGAAPTAAAGATAGPVGPRGWAARPER